MSYVVSYYNLLLMSWYKMMKPFWMIPKLFIKKIVRHSCFSSRRWLFLSGGIWDKYCSNTRDILTTVCAWLWVWWNNGSSRNIWAVGPNLNILDNSILIVDKKLFLYLGWLGTTRVLHQKPPNFEAFRSWLDFFTIY